MTKQRVLIKNIILSSPKHLTAEEIYEISKEKMPGIALGTVYRNLGKLCEENEIHLISMRGFPDCYDKWLKPHGHLICDSCGSVEDFPINDISGILPTQEIKDIYSYDVIVHYACAECRKSG